MSRRYRQVRATRRARGDAFGISGNRSRRDDARESGSGRCSSGAAARGEDVSPEGPALPAAAGERTIRRPRHIVAVKRGAHAHARRIPGRRCRKVKPGRRRDAAGAVTRPDARTAGTGRIVRIRRVIVQRLPPEPAVNSRLGACQGTDGCDAAFSGKCRVAAQRGSRRSQHEEGRHSCHNTWKHEGRLFGLRVSRNARASAIATAGRRQAARCRASGSILPCDHPPANRPVESPERECGQPAWRRERGTDGSGEQEHRRVAVSRPRPA